MLSLHIDTARSWRGGQNQVLLTVRGLLARGHHVAVAVHPQGELKTRLPEEAQVLPIAPKNELDFIAAWRLARAIRKLRPDIVHAHDPHGVAMAATSLAMTPFEARPQFVASRRVDFHLKRNWFSRWKHRQVNHFIAASDAIRNMLIQDGISAGRISTVHEGVDIEQISRLQAIDPRSEFSFPAEAIVVGNVAALVPHKGQTYLVEAAAQVIKEFPTARFLVLGEGALRLRLEEQVKQLHLEQHFKLAGFRQDVIALLKGFDLFVMSSVTEGLGTSLLDAMAAARPIVATTAGGIPEVVIDGESGILVPPQNSRALAEAILQLLKHDDQRLEIAKAGLARVRKMFGAERMVEETLAIYRMLERRRPVNPA